MKRIFFSLPYIQMHLGVQQKKQVICSALVGGQMLTLLFKHCFLKHFPKVVLNEAGEQHRTHYNLTALWKQWFPYKRLFCFEEMIKTLSS